MTIFLDIVFLYRHAGLFHALLQVHQCSAESFTARAAETAGQPGLRFDVRSTLQEDGVQLIISS